MTGIVDQLSIIETPPDVEPPRLKSIEEALADFGFRHERDANSVADGKHRIFDDQGRNIGRMDAFAAYRLVEDLRYGVDEPGNVHKELCTVIEKLLSVWDPEWEPGKSLRLEAIAVLAKAKAA